MANIDNAAVPNGLVEGCVLAKKQWTEKLFSLEVAASIDEYVAGQFTKLGLLNSEGEWVRRAYSMVNHPKHLYGQNYLEFLIIADDNGQLSPKLNDLEVGDKLFVGKQPSGFMTLEEIPDYAKELWMLSTGTAIGPFLSILDDPSIAERFDNIVLVHAVRTESELVYSESIESAKTALGDKFHFVSIVSREVHATGLQGRIPELLLNGEIQNMTGVTLSVPDSFVYICGNPAMVKDTSAALGELGLTKHLRRKPGNFASENYW
ncbi:Ferredoxin--NADP reductase [Vibrio thalassae]|uniref:ferredoxin--NADP(+) reductase n=1 Tax=Vibrio thalassae TaxID=1243014 RepID=A0A240EMG2_9VIBR|nr:ferredoxin--NADP reductase [Vibrio thalassae]SNX49349.1 Ferredoxin--NADP reductase [Vibrio thalassae]